MTSEKICTRDDILPNSGACVLFNGEQVAIFRIQQAGNDSFYALSNYDPFSEANVISRGLVGSIDGKTVVASPIYKQHFCLNTGQCLEDENVQLNLWDVSLEGSDILLSAKTN